MLPVATNLHVCQPGTSNRSRTRNFFGRLMVGLLSFAGCAQTWGQAADPFGGPVQGIPMQALRPARATRLPQLSDLTPVKLDRHDGQLQLVMMLESFRTEKRTGQVTAFRQEQKTRTVNIDGKPVEQTYTVTIPFLTEGDVEVKIPAGRKPVTKPADQFRFIDLSGKELTAEAASTRLESLQPAFLVDRFAGELPAIPEIYQQALQTNCLIILTEEAVREHSQSGANSAPGQALPAQRFEVPAEKVLK